MYHEHEMDMCIFVNIIKCEYKLYFYEIIHNPINEHHAIKVKLHV